jgi:arylformamidase
MDLGPRTPVYPGDPAVSVEQVRTDGSVVHQICFGTHSGTHIDAPVHMIDGGASLGAFGLDTFVAPGCLVDIRRGSVLAALEDARLAPGDIAVMWTGISDRQAEADYLELVPSIPVEAAEYLVAAGVVMVGIDAPSIDAAPYPLHHTLLGAGVLLLENLVGLDRLENQSFELWALPLRLDYDGSPARVLARLG